MDKSWLQKGRCSPEYFQGCMEFLEFAWSHRPSKLGDTIYCPCINCINRFPLSKNEVKEHILEQGILRTYTRWTKHGEAEEDVINIRDETRNVNNGDGMHIMLQDDEHI
ncbi:hypothetical protein BVC80_9035g42 [Macleaya cordata]|uniref:Transposase-associated domain-containing protein n=1 Tax=Macleaya cordata TaxID=56857 RepID=A0A200QYL8_MACCD|nr:hypothetical protein BVC80_9035g42 [Macleaya cordata]